MERHRPYMVQLDVQLVVNATTADRAASDAVAVIRRLGRAPGMTATATAKAVRQLDDDAQSSRHMSKVRLESAYADVQVGPHWATVTVTVADDGLQFNAETCGPGPLDPTNVGTARSLGEALHLACAGQPASNRLPSSSYAVGGPMRRVSILELVMEAESHRRLHGAGANRT